MSDIPERHPVNPPQDNCGAIHNPDTAFQMIDRHYVDNRTPVQKEADSLKFKEDQARSTENPGDRKAGSLAFKKKLTS